MKSPFPGMDPYLEQHWGDIHSRLIIYGCDELQAGLPGSLFARVEERVFVQTEEEGQGRSLYPDVRVVEHGNGESAMELATTVDVAVEEEPILIPRPHERIRETSIAIYDADSGNRVVTVIEMLSPSNKTPGEGQTLYLSKQRECIEAGVSLVEIDLLRTGQRKLVIPNSRIPRRHRTLYQISVFRGWKPDVGEIYPVPPERRLPRIRIPLREQDQDVRLDLQALLDRAYRNGRYFATIDYKAALDPPLPDKENRLARQFIRQMNKR